ncbi:MAG: 50S ribosomal protein L14 [Patescibacteria group bacterium]|nr:MAG: 50S ribosomal protein L14 [Patescibacteria group bacterium]
MLQLRSMLTVADNSGAKKVMLIGIPGQGRKKYAYIGDVITVTVKEADPQSDIKKGNILYAVIVRTRKEKRREDGSYIRFDDNACVILQGKETKDPKGTKVFGPIAKEIRDLGFLKVAALAPEMY